MSYTIMTEDIETGSRDISSSNVDSELSTLYTITEVDEDTDDDTQLYKMQYGSVDNIPFCVICLDVTSTPYGCFQCKECIICEGCIGKLSSKHRKKCPVCRKGKKWCKIIETNKAYILKNDEQEVIRENNRLQHSLVGRQRANLIFCRAGSFILFIFTPFFVYMGLKIMNHDI